MPSNTEVRALLLAFDVVPVREHLGGVEVVADEVAEDMWMAPHELVVDAVGDVGDREPSLLLGDRGVELDLVEQVAEFLDQIGVASVSPSPSRQQAWTASTTS